MWDLGLASHELAALTARFALPSHEQPVVRLRHFDFERFPSWMHIASAPFTRAMMRNHSLPRPTGEYAWKAAIMRAEFEEAGERASLLWLDAACRLEYPDMIRTFQTSEARTAGFVGFVGIGKLRDWVRPELFERFSAWTHRNEPMCMGGAFAFSTAGLGPRLLAAWAKCSLDLDCISPGDASRSNSRQEQSVLSVLAAANGIRQCQPARNSSSAPSRHSPTHALALPPAVQPAVWAWVGEMAHPDVDCPCTEALCRSIHAKHMWPGGQRVNAAALHLQWQACSRERGSSGSTRARSVWLGNATLGPTSGARAIGRKSSSG